MEEFKKYKIEDLLEELYDRAEEKIINYEYMSYEDKNNIEKKIMEFCNDDRPVYSDILYFITMKYDLLENEGVNAGEKISYLSDLIDRISEDITDKNAKKMMKKIVDYINLENLRMDRFKDMIGKASNEISEISEKSYDIEGNIKDLRKKLLESKRDIKNMKFDLIALVTLVFTGFTVVSSNVSIVTAIMNAKEIQYTPFEIVISLIMCNLMIVLVIFSIYSIVRKIHGDIETKEMHRSLGASTAILILLVIILSVLIFCGKRI